MIVLRISIFLSVVYSDLHRYVFLNGFSEMKSLQPSYCKEVNRSKEIGSNQLGARCRGELQIPEPIITKKVIARCAMVPMKTRSKAGESFYHNICYFFFHYSHSFLLFIMTIMFYHKLNSNISFLPQLGQTPPSRILVWSRLKTS